MKRLASYLMLSIALHAGVGWLLHEFRVKPQALAWQVPITIQLVSLAQATPALATEPVRPALQPQPAATAPLPEPAVKLAAKAITPKAEAPRSQPAIAKSVPPPRSKPLGEPRPARSERAPAAPPARPTAVAKSGPAVASTVASPPPLAPVVSLRPSFVSPPPPPRYPSQARRRNQQGTVRVEVSLDERGNQLKLTLVRSSGIESLDQAALEAVTQWRFRPEVVDGRAMPSRVEIPIEFALTANR
ncbi:energy transducer TonB [Pseudomonas auratipiscis]|uniref:Energy transducer TonB n=1 Tax=Pseudomonas auratipiscis TaxID=3115853 RepID=A0AB35WWL7_9PSED|nr:MULTISPECIES: energy transducer TonB [unclassified Pseudomonas]MEE1868635.1 energy transducer TonB [Pseudomonas sp. 120P]MEE1959296.1 energy transducer TonB [Pseudomonas sp. 119P]